MELEGIIVDIDYVVLSEKSVIRLTLKSNEKTYTIFDNSFLPYFYIIPNNNVKIDFISNFKENYDGRAITPEHVEEVKIKLKGTLITAFKIYLKNTRDVSHLSEVLSEFGERYEYDILFWKRYLIDKNLIPLNGVKILCENEGDLLIIKKITNTEKTDQLLKYICFDIETYNPLGAPRPEIDPSIMISYTDGKNKEVITTKSINKNFVKTFQIEKEMIDYFSNLIKENDYDAIVGYNSSNFDMPYLIKRSSVTKASFNISRYGDIPKQEHHGLLEAIKIPGRANIDVYNVAKFVSVVGASEKLIKANRFTLSEVYAAITGDTKKMVDRLNIWQIWDGPQEGIDNLAEYSLADSLALEELYKFFIPLEIELSKVSGSTIAETCISTTGQLVEYILMRYAHENNELIPNKPSDKEIIWRNSNPIEGAFVKAPDAGIYNNIVVFDFRGLYPSIIIAYNIDPSTLTKNKDIGTYESPTQALFIKQPMGIIPKVLKLLIEQRSEVKKAYKKDPDNKSLGSRSTALKILANSFYGYLGYARSRWYSRESAESVTAFGREYIKKTMESAEKHGFKVLYSDTDSIFLELAGKSKEEALAFQKDVNNSLPESMELELEDFYKRGVFVGKRGESSKGAKKKYAMLSESGRIKIKGFELVRRDWSGISRNTQKQVLETILNVGSKEKAISIVKDVIKNLREGKIPIKELVIQTQLRKKIDNYDSTSPELAAVKKAISRGQKQKRDMEGATISYVITRNGSTISEKAELEEFAENYDSEYYITHQIIPATLKILKELGVSEEELKGLGSQKKLM
ncbi:MAG: DNA-directed DNA polymerase [Candidatus Micrarchaeaceae archaeon]